MGERTQHKGDKEKAVNGNSRPQTPKVLLHVCEILYAVSETSLLFALKSGI